MEEKIRLKITMTEQNIKDYVYGQTLKSLRGIAFFALGVLAIVILVLTWNDQGTLAKVCLIGIAAIYLVVQPVMTILKANTLSKRPELFVPIEYEIDEEEVAVTQREEHIVYRWEDGFRFVVKKNLLLMYVSRINAYILPKDQLGEDYTRLLTMAKNHGCPVRA
jgi:hypothetical protein